MVVLFLFAERARAVRAARRRPVLDDLAAHEARQGRGVRRLQVGLLPPQSAARRSLFRGQYHRQTLFIYQAIPHPARGDRATQTQKASSIAELWWVAVKL